MYQKHYFKTCLLKRKPLVTKDKWSKITYFQPVILWFSDRSEDQIFTLYVTMMCNNSSSPEKCVEQCLVWKRGGHSWDGDSSRGGSMLGCVQLSARGRQADSTTNRKIRICSTPSPVAATAILAAAAAHREVVYYEVFLLFLVSKVLCKSQELKILVIQLQIPESQCSFLVQLLCCFWKLKNAYFFAFRFSEIQTGVSLACCEAEGCLG